jgi:predicted ATPase
LVDAVAHLAEILVQTSPGLRIIVTSQIPLGIAPERVFRLAGLALPDGPVNVVSATGYSAIAFFVDRAQAADRHFTLTDDNVDLVVEICRQLDGLPLAMELAAARLQSVGLRGLSVALEHRFRLLTGGRRLAPARQQTLEAALDWSHELLDTREQAVFRRLGVFVGSFALSTAQRVAADEQLDEWAVVDALTVLVDRSLVVTTEHDPPRYRLLDSPRAYALARLHGVDEDQTVARRHALAMRDRFWQADQDWQSGRLGVDAFRADIQPDLADGRVALTWAVRHESEVAVALAPCLDWAMVNEPPGTVRRALWETTAPLVADTMPVELRARWWMGWSSWTTQFGGIALRDKQRRAIDEVRRLGDRRALVWMLRGRLWTLAISEGGGPEAIEESDRCIHEIRAMEEPSWPPVLRYMRMRGESEYSRISGDQPESIRWLRRAGALAQDACDSRARHSAMVALVDAELSMQRYDDAARDAGELVEALCSTPFESTLTYGRHNLALAHIWRRDFAAARMVVTHSWPLSARFDILGLLANNLALLAAFEGRLVDAARLAGYANHQNELRGQDRQSNESRAVREAERLAVAALGVEEFIRLKAEGRTLTKAELRQLAI